MKRLLVLALIVFVGIGQSSIAALPPTTVPTSAKFVVSVFCDTGVGHNSGGGVVIDKDRGLVMTVAHVLEGERAFIGLPQNDIMVKVEIFAEDVLYFDLRQDIAIVRIKQKELLRRSAPLTTRYPQVGNAVKLYGFRENEKEGLMTDITVPLVAWFPSMLLAHEGKEAKMFLSAKLKKEIKLEGLSGFPLLNNKGEVVGILKAYYGNALIFVPVGAIPQKYLPEQ